MARARQPNRTTWHYYDRQGRLRATTGPHDVTRYQWDAMHLVDVTATPRPTIPPPPHPNPYRLDTLLSP